MKKIFTFLILLAAFFIMPRSAQAAVEWEVSDGTQWRINPNNPSDPNDSILIPAGTKFWRIVVYYNTPMYINRHYAGYMTVTPYLTTRIGQRLLISSQSSRTYETFSLRIRLAERNLGYNFAQITYGNNDVKSQLGSNSVSLSGLSSLSNEQKARWIYLKKVIITEEECLAIKSLNFDPVKLGMRQNLTGVTDFDDLERFPNLEELYLANNPHLGEYEYYGGKYNVEYFITILASFPKLRILDLSNSGSRSKPYLFCLPQQSLEYLYMSNTKFDGIDMSNHTNLKKVDTRGGTTPLLNTSNCPLLDTLLVAGPKLSVLNCRNCNLTELDLTSCTSLKKLYCYGNMLDTLTINSPYLEHLECQENNITSLSLGVNGVPAVYGQPTPVPYEYKEYGDNGIMFIYRYSGYSTNDSGGDTTYNWNKYTYTSNSAYQYEEPDFYDEESYTYYWYVSRQVVTNPSIPVQYSREIIIPEKGLRYLDCSENNLSNLQLPDNPKFLEQLYCYNNKLTELDLTSCTSLQKLRMSHNKIPQIDVSNCKELVEIYAKNRIGEPGFAGWNHGLTSLDCSGLTKLTEVRLSRNKMTSLDMSGCSSLRILTCDNQGGSDARTLEVLNLTGCSSLNSLDCQNNALTSLDLSTCTKLAPSGITAYVQRAVKDVKVIDRDKVCIELVNGVTPTIEDNSTISDTHMDNYFGTWTGSGFDKTRNKVIKRDGKTYLVIYDISDDARGGTQRKYDIDFYGNKLKYQYAISSNSWDETLGGSLANGKKTDNVTVTIYPYVMYVNPLSKDIHSEEVTQQGKEPFYSGTIYLDYDAIVPAGATAYIAKKIKINQNLIYSTAGGGHQKVTADQLQLVPLVAGEGASEVVIPAYTPVYVKSDTEFGLFSFDRNNHGGIEQALGYAQDGSHLTKDNILRGVLTDSAITKYSVLSLGRGRPKGSDDNGYTTESRIGFWPFSGTTIPAHRVFIPIGELENAGVNNNSPGLLFSFTNDIDENTTTGIRSAVINKNEGWYTINGVRMNGRPTEKGIYIHNGRKEVIR